MSKTTVLTFCGYYLPGCKAGGPIPSIANLVERVSDEFHFRIVTRDRDLGSKTAYTDCARDTWKQVGKAEVLYLQPDQLKFRNIVDILRSTHHDGVYLNSFFSRPFTIYPLLAQSLGLVRPSPILLAPRGEFASAALSRKRLAKSAYLALSKKLLARLPITWQASSRYESQDILRHLGSAQLHIASDLPALPPPPPTTSCPKQVGKAKILFLSRIHPIKNLEGAIEILRTVQGEIEFNVVGPLEDPVYWERCQQLARGLPSTISMKYCGAAERDQIILLMRQHDLLLLPTFGENFGHVILEALSAGTPALISDQTPWRDLEPSGVGWVYPLSDINAFREAINTIVQMDEVSRNRIASKAWKYASDFCLDDALVKQNRQLFRSGLNLKPSASAASHRAA